MRTSPVPNNTNPANEAVPHTMPDIEEIPPSHPHADRARRAALGKKLRDTVSRLSQGKWKPARGRVNPITLLGEADSARLPELLAIRRTRMAQSPLSFLRGSAAIMAGDLAATATTHIRVQLCGDCHLNNFGWFATPERNLVFDINDFDESLPGPWEWDVKRLAASAVVAARQCPGKSREKDQRQAALAVAQAYRTRMAELAELTTLELWYLRLDANWVVSLARTAAQRQAHQRVVDRARSRTIESLLPKLTEQTREGPRFRENKPLVFHADDDPAFRHFTHDLLQRYSESLQEDRSVLLHRFHLADVAYKVVGVGSVGWRCAVALLVDADQAPLLLQFKEARPSVLAAHCGPGAHTHQGHRIVHGQRMMQSASDLFLGWAQGGDGRDYYVRQLRDMKMSVAVEQMELDELCEYLQLCGWALARAHAKSGQAAAIAGYLGNSDNFDRAMANFGELYADQNAKDYQKFLRGGKKQRPAASQGKPPEIVAP